VKPIRRQLIEHRLVLLELLVLLGLHGHLASHLKAEHQVVEALGPADPVDDLALAGSDIQGGVDPLL
jgi:hypothetical protein